MGALGVDRPLFGVRARAALEGPCFLVVLAEHIFFRWSAVRSAQQPTLADVIRTRHIMRRMLCTQITLAGGESSEGNRKGY